ncbi:hypothetical protein [Glycomyces xiaoerkulensis]|uniref:hypothetical protein n=1 Tax=Glycomyces xiaoerkulensis TaxID=2038139 RepID=UPI0012FFE9EE|nr:hypothetical protein [Glycomyces xiaoerkulensis]
MPKTPHEALHHLFRDDPDLFRRALKECLGEDFPVFRGVAAIDSDLTEIKPVIREVDTAMRIETDTGAEILVIEPQSTVPTRAKQRAWHWYLAYLEAYFGLPATLIILTADPATAAACRAPMTLGPERRASATIHPFVIGPDNTPFITDLAQAAEDIMLAIMAALTHRNHPDIAIALDVLAEALDGIDLESAKFFAEYIEVGLGEGSAHDHWRSIIMTMTYPFASGLRRELKALGRAEGRAEGREQGRAQGREQGREQGRVQGRAEALFGLLSMRGIELRAEDRDRVLRCEDEQIYLGWLQRAATAETAADVFEPTD